jgi:hypothetical protein
VDIDKTTISKVMEVSDLVPEYLSIRMFVSTRHSIQRMTADTCALYEMSHWQCGRLASVLAREAQRAILARETGLPSVQIIPSKHNPFVFLHIEKCGGSTLRR